MNIIFVCLGNPYTPEMLYKENYFIKAAVEENNNVLVIASKYLYKDGSIVKTSLDEENIDGYKLIRLDYKKILNSYFTNKVRKVENLSNIIIDFKPDLIFYNCPQIYNIQDLKQIKAKIPNVRIVLDFSTKYLNSARNWLSLNIQHKIIYKRWFKKAIPYIDRIFYISSDSKQFVREVYDLPENLLEYNNLPGEIVSRENKRRCRLQFENKYGLEKNNIIFSHSGKMGKLKRTVELIKIFSENEDPRFRLFIAGNFENDIKHEAIKLISKDNRIIYLGFLNGEELKDLLCASDMYLQPGTISQTSQTAICCGCPIAFMKCPTNEELYNGNGYLLDYVEEFDKVFKEISSNRELLETMSELSYKLGQEDLECFSLYHKVIKVNK